MPYITKSDSTTSVAYTPLPNESDPDVSTTPTIPNNTSSDLVSPTININYIDNLLFYNAYTEAKTSIICHLIHDIKEAFLKNDEKLTLCVNENLLNLLCCNIYSINKNECNFHFSIQLINFENFVHKDKLTGYALLKTFIKERKISNLLINKIISRKKKR